METDKQEAQYSKYIRTWNFPTVDWTSVLGIPTTCTYT